MAENFFFTKQIDFENKNLQKQNILFQHIQEKVIPNFKIEKFLLKMSKTTKMY